MSEEFTPEIIFDKFKERQLESGPSLDLLISLLEHGNDERSRASAINIMGKICLESKKDKKILKILENHLLSDESFLVRASAVEAIIKLFPKKCKDPLLWMLQHESSGYVLNKMAVTLSKVDNEGFGNLKQIISSNLDKLARVYDIERTEFFVLLELGINMNFFSHDRSSSIFGVIYGNENNFAINQGHVVALTLRNVNFLPESIGYLSHLEHLDVRNNQITSIPNSIGQLKRLRNLWLSNNRINILPDSIIHLTRLQTLRLGANHLMDLPNGLKRLRNLKILELQANYLKEFPLPITEMESLEQLDLSSNQIETIPVSIQHLSNLNALWIKKNMIQELAFSLTKLRNLKTLDLQGNNLNSLPSDLDSLKSLYHLNLKDNAFKNVPEVIEKLKKREMTCLLL